MVVTIHSIKHLPKQKKIDTKFKALFGTSIASATLCMLTTMTATLSCISGFIDGSNVSLALSIPSYFILIFLLLATFIARLYYTFRDSAYAVSYKDKSIFLVLYIICCVAGAAAMILYVISIFSDKYSYENVWISPDNKLIAFVMTLFFICLIVYISISIWAAVIFVSNLMKVTQLSGNVMENGYVKAKSKLNTSDDDTNDDSDEMDVDCVSPQLNERQIKMIDNVARYSTLFSVAIGSSIITLIVMSSGEYIHWGSLFIQILFIFLNTDCTINIACLYLQYNFTTKYYRKYVKFIERIWKPFFIKKAKYDMIEAYHLEKMENENDTQMTALNESSGDE